ncbi:MAG: putative 2OG-Fe(II) oxygenase [Novosphingobium sp.]
MHSGSSPANPDSVYRDLHGKLRQGHFEAVRDELLATYPTPPREARFEQLLGLAHRGVLDSADAHAAFVRAAADLPADPLLAHSLARAALEAGWNAAALFERARCLAPTDTSVLTGRAAARLAEGDGQTALNELAALLASQPDWIEGHRTFAQIAAVIAPEIDSGTTLRAALTRDPAKAALWHALIENYLGGYRYELALAAVHDAHAALGPSLALDQLKATALGESGHPETALAILSRLPLPADGDGAICALRNLIRCGRYRDARALAELPYPEPGLGAVWPYRALVWRLLGDPRWEWLEGDPRLIGICDISSSLTSLGALARCLRELHLGSGAPLNQSVRGGTQTDGHLFARAEPEIRELRGAIDQAVADYVTQLPPPDPAHPTLATPRNPLRYAGAWSVRLRGAGYHHDHVHTHGWISSALYVALPDTCNDDDEAGWLAFGENRRLLPDLAGFRTVQPVPGRLVLFPSTMWHGTRPFSSGERLTVAFDVARPQR